MILAVTGHRPDKIGGYNAAAELKLIDFAKRCLLDLQNDHNIERVITGMAQGWDQAIAQAAIDYQIPFTAAIPCAGQSRLWPKLAQLKYESLIAKADAVKMVNVGEYSAAKMEARNQWLVDQSTHLLALWNRSSGGTGNTVDYANMRMREVINVWDKWKAFNQK